MSNVHKFEDFKNKLDKNKRRELPELKEGVAYPTTKPTVAPGIKQSPGKPSPLRRDKPSVVPGPKAVTELDLANKFLSLTENNNEVISLLRKKYNK